MVTIKVRQNGRYVVEGEDVVLLDWNGAPYQRLRCTVAKTNLQRSATGSDNDLRVLEFECG